MMNGKHFLPVICGLLHCISTAITVTRVQQYEVVVMVFNYTNPSHSARRQTSNSCRGSNCSCCDGHRNGSDSCSDHCDSSFVYCLRKVATPDGSGCPGGGSILTSNTNYDDRSIDFSQNTVLGLDNPLVFQGLSDTWEGVQLFVRVWDTDHSNAIELIDEVKWNITQDLGVPSGVVTLTGMYEIVTMKVNITVLCVPVPGFTGMMCDENIDDCVGVLCGENGHCVDGVNSFTCNCTSGFTGVYCNETDECVNITCSGRGRCVDGVSSYVCDCDAGYTGRMCEIDIDYCSNITSVITMTRVQQYEVVVMVVNYTNPSHSARRQISNSCRGSNCSCCDGHRDGSGGCSDHCDSSFVYCLRKVDTPDGSDCSGGGTILRSYTNYDDRSIDFSQNTVLGLDNPLVFQGLSDTWEGVQLYVRIWDIDEGNSLEFIDEVKWNITQDLGVPSCVVTLTGMYEIVTMKVNITVFCVPVPGFTGVMCDENIDDCVGISCGENRHCVDGVNSYTCNCNSGFTGVSCNEIDECANVTCSERGQCVDGVASYVCDCDAGYTGESCEININDCLPNPCGERGQCLDGVNSFICRCTPGFTGELCQINTDDCLLNPCGERGQCVDGDNSFTCNCTSGFNGALCNETDECVNVTCSERGQCVDGVASYMCDCDAGYTGENCEINIDDCLSNPCGEAGLCVDEVNSFICMCIPGFTGELCQINIDDCVEVSCSGNGKCVDGLDSFMCVCHPGFTEELCQINIDDCAGVSCSGNGQCVDGVNSFTCNCTSGFTGALCNETDECVNVTCSERGQCVDGVASYVCDCDAGYTGENCEMSSSKCLSNPCGERGQCIDGVDSFICMCNPGFTGELCQTNIDDCVGVNCSGNGECVDEVNTFTCECSPGYRGPLCDKVNDRRQNIPVIPIVSGAAVALILILILTVLVFITLKCASKCCSKLVSTSVDSAMSKTQNELIEMKKNEVYGVFIAALEPERSPQESV